jgi:hypothetical protein
LGLRPSGFDPTRRVQRSELKNWIIRIQGIASSFGYQLGNKTRHSGRSGAESRNPEKVFQLLVSRLRGNDERADIRWAMTGMPDFD